MASPRARLRPDCAVAIRLAIPLLTCAWLLFPAPGAGLPAGPPADPGVASLITDGSVYHHAGNLWLNITNFDLIGSKPLIPSTYSGAPSGLWPAPGGKNYLCRAYLWVGGVLGGLNSASTEGELRSTEDPLDVIYETVPGDPGGMRYPFGDPDDDGDGVADEDPRNGLDDDGDGLIDEDFAAISDQDLRLRMVDDTPEAQAQYPTHRPLHVEVIQQSYQWAGEQLGDFIGFDFTVRNLGAEPLTNVYIGFFADFDLPLEPGAWLNDMAGIWDGPVPLAGGGSLPLFAGYMHDGAVSTPGPRLGVVLLDHTTDPAGVTAPAAVGVRAFRTYDDMMAYPIGMPENDSQIFGALSFPGRSTIHPYSQGDYKFLLSVGPFTPLAPGQAVGFQVAVVAGASLDAMLQTAALAKLTYAGRAYDRDGDPATGPDGRECQVHWLPPDRAPTSAASGRLTAELLPAGGPAAAEAVRLRIEARNVVVADLRLERSGPAVADRRLWTAVELLGPGGVPDPATSTPEYVQADFTDTDPAGWPRTYRLLLSPAAGGTLELGRLDIAAPPLPPRPTLAARPNPFNPRTTIRFSLPAAGPARLAIYDLAGRLVRTLAEGEMTAGVHTAIWDGTDRSGKVLASGSYLARVQAGTQVETVSVSLVR